MEVAETAACRKCRSEISTEALACPQCGYEPRTQGQTARNIGVLISFLLCLTLVGAIVGGPLLLLIIYAEYKVKARMPTTYDPP